MTSIASPDSSALSWRPMHQEEASQGETRMSLPRRPLLRMSAASAGLGGIAAPHVARAERAEFTYKYANNLPDTQPLNVRAKEMAAAIKAETNGKFDQIGRASCRER